MFSKPLKKNDQSAFDFSVEMLNGNPVGGINIETIYNHPKNGYFVFEFLLCDEKQHVNPFTSHPNRYWHKNKMKFISLYAITQALEGTLFLVNYAKKGTPHEDKVLLIRVEHLDDSGIVDETKYEFTRQEFSDFLINLNRECLKG